MSESFIPIAVEGRRRSPAIPTGALEPIGLLADTLSRPLRDLRISVTDRCNFRCTYCMPRSAFGADHVFLPHAELLTFEEIVRIARAAIAHGVEKIRLTGGEPLLRKNIERLIEMLAQLRTHDGQPIDLTLTTNASILAKKARSLFDAGLRRVTVSLDALDETIFQRINDAEFPVSQVLRGIDAAAAAGLAPIKVNMVVQRGVNEDQIVPMATHFRGTGHIVRFIEFMDVGRSNGWRLDDVVPSAEVLRRIEQEFPLEPLGRQVPGEVAERWRYRDGQGEVGFISSVTRAFCNECTRARLSTDGQLYSCLFATRGDDLRSLIRAGVDDADLAKVIASIWTKRADRYSELRGIATPELQSLPKIEMSYIGG